MILLTFIILNGWSSDTLLAEGYTSYPNQYNIVCDGNGNTHGIWFKWQISNMYSVWYGYYPMTQWTSFENLSTGVAQSFNYSPSIASWTSEFGDTYLYALWQSNWVSHIGEGYFRIAMRKFSAMGEWEDTIGFVSPDSMDAFTPCAVCHYKGVVHIVWEEGYEICYRNLMDSEFSGGILLSNSGVYAAYPAIATFGDKIFVVWEDLRDGNFEIYFKEFDGNKWKQEERITSSAGASLFPSLCVDSSGAAHIVWQEDTIGGYKILYTNYTQGSFDTSTTVVESPGEAVSPSIVSVGNKVHLVWSDSRDGDWEIYYKVKNQESKNGWGTPLRLTYNSGVSANPSISADKNGNLYLLFWDTRDGSAKVYFKKKVQSLVAKVQSSKLRIYPNPFRKKTSIEFSVGQGFSIANLKVCPTIQIYDLTGRLVKSLPITEHRTPITEVVWDGKDNNGVKLSSGIYFLKVDLSRHVYPDAECVGGMCRESQNLNEKIVEKIILLR